MDMLDAVLIGLAMVAGAFAICAAVAGGQAERRFQEHDTSRVDRAWTEFERFAATGDEDYLIAGADLMFEADFDLYIEAELERKRELS